MFSFNVNTRYLSNHHSILGPARFLPRESWRGPIFGGGWGHFHHHHHRPFFGGFGGGMIQQNITIDNGRHGFWGNLADGLEGFVRGFSNISWLMGGGQMGIGMGTPMGLGMPMSMGMPMGMPGMALPMTGVPQQQVTQTPQDNTANQELANLKKFGDASGFSTIVKESDGTYTAYNPKTKDHVSGDYETVKNAILKDKDDDDDGDDSGDKIKDGKETKPQGAGDKDGKPMKAEEFKKFDGKSVLVTDEKRIANGESEDLVNITGKTTFGEIDEKSKYPKTIKVGNVTYTLVETNYEDKGGVLYQSDSRTKGGEKYRLEWKDDNPVLVQHEEDTKLGAGTVDVHKS